MAQHMMTGKSVQRAFHGHQPMDTCINDIVVVSDLLEGNPEFESLMEKMYSSLVAKETTLESAATSDLLREVKEKMDTKKFAQDLG